MNMMEADDLDFVVMESMIPGSFLEQVTAQTEWAVQGGKHGTLAKIRRLKETRETRTLEEKATTTELMGHNFHLDKWNFFFTKKRLTANG